VTKNLSLGTVSNNGINDHNPGRAALSPGAFSQILQYDTNNVLPMNTYASSIVLPEATVHAATATGFDACYGDSSAHLIKCALNNTNFHKLPVMEFGSCAMAAGTTCTFLRVRHFPARRLRLPQLMRPRRFRLRLTPRSAQSRARQLRLRQASPIP